MHEDNYLWLCEFSQKPMLATVRVKDGVTWIRITRDDKFVSHYGYRGKAATKQIAKLRAKGIRA